MKRINVLYFRVEDVNYPRNREIRSAIVRDGRFSLRLVQKSTASHKLNRAIADVSGLWRCSKGADIILLSEMNLSYSPLVWVVAKLRGAKVVVDGFVGLYETAVEDWGLASPGSWAARRFWLQDALAWRSADLYLIDTDHRADRLRNASSSGTAVTSVPVGAPEWATSSSRRINASQTLEILYYGNYIPLHGLDLIASALSLVRQQADVHVVLIGDGPGRSAAEARFDELGLRAISRFDGPVPERDLRARIAEADIVLGVFGSSPKARAVIANKVWQGLASGKVVVTQDSPSLDEIRAIVGPQLIATEPGSPIALANALLSLVPPVEFPSGIDTHTKLAQYCRERMKHFLDLLAMLGSARKDDRP